MPDVDAQVERSQQAASAVQAVVHVDEAGIAGSIMKAQAAVEAGRHVHGRRTAAEEGEHGTARRHSADRSGTAGIGVDQANAVQRERQAVVAAAGAVRIRPAVIEIIDRGKITDSFEIQHDWRGGRASRSERGSDGASAGDLVQIAHVFPMVLAAGSGASGYARIAPFRKQGASDRKPCSAGAGLSIFSTPGGRQAVRTALSRC